jgi:Pyruvate/2-oxoacid:ferredoxin oxidoreductase delta subunit
VISKKKKRNINRPKAIVDITYCTGCEVCVQVCPVDCIEIAESELNFNGIAEIDGEICTGCNLCAIDCPWEAISMIKSDGSYNNYGKQLIKMRGYA